MKQGSLLALPAKARILCLCIFLWCCWKDLEESEDWDLGGEGGGGGVRN